MPNPYIVQDGTLTPSQYTNLHNWVRKHRGKPSKCSHCFTETAKAFDWANISGRNLKDLDDWIRLCRSCHRIMDAPRRYATHCKRGHEYTEGSYTRKFKPDGSQNGRQCSKCQTMYRIRSLVKGGKTPMSSMIICKSCKGEGLQDGLGGPVDCWDCKGDGVVRARDEHGRFTKLSKGGK